MKRMDQQHMNKENKIMLGKEAVAAELFSAAWCNLDCKYCYIPKHNQMIKDKHQEIIKEVKEVTPLLERLDKLYGQNLEILSHWGTEPSLTIEHFKDFYKGAVRKFANLNTVSFSSNFLQNTEKVVDFIKTFPKDRQFTFDVQMSLDGPPWITDENRRGGITEKIVDNMVKFVELLNQDEIFHSVKTHFKPTVSKEQFYILIQDNNLLNYYKFWDEVCTRLKKANKRNNVQTGFNCDPTIVCPDDYTQQDGINFNTLYENTMELAKNHNFKTVKPSFGYYNAFVKIAKLSDEFFTKQKMFTCSAGDTQFGISEYLHPCHDTFYHPYDEIKDSFCKDIDRTNSEEEINNIKVGRFDLTRDNTVVDYNTDNIDLYRYKLRAFHDFAKFKVSYGVAVTKELAHAGLVSPCYKYDDMATLLAYYVNSRHSCPTGNISHIGSKFLNPISYFKLFGNGLIENFLKRYYRSK